MIFFEFIAFFVDIEQNYSYNKRRFERGGKTVVTIDEDIAFSNPELEVDFNIWNQMNTQLHDHTFFEIMVVLEGALSHFINGQKEVLKVGDIRFIRPTDCHFQNSHADNKATTLNVSFTHRFIESCLEMDSGFKPYFENSQVPPTNHLNDLCLQHVRFLADTITQSEAGWEEVRNIKLLIFNCLNYLFLFNDKTKNDLGKPDWLLAFVRSLDDPQNFKLSINELCQRVNYTPSSMSVIFKKYMGKTIVQYWVDVKINYARNLLRNTNYSVLDISDLLGYDSLSHFYHVFKTNVGLTPVQYRKGLNKAETEKRNYE